MNEATINAIANAVAARLKTPVFEPLWDLDRVASYLGYEPRVVREKKMLEKGFPKAIRLPSLRWEPEEIREYARKRKERT